MIYVVYAFAIFGATVFLGLFGILSWLMYEYDHDDPRLHGDGCPCDRCAADEEDPDEVERTKNEAWEHIDAVLRHEDGVA